MEMILTALFTDTNRTRLVRKARPVDSFFNFFSPPDPPSEEAIENGEIEEEELENLEEKIEIDYQIGEDLKEKVGFPNKSQESRSDWLSVRSSPVQLITLLAKH